jgi:hypothetical protein
MIIYTPDEVMREGLLFANYSDHRQQKDRSNKSSNGRSIIVNAKKAIY